MPLRRRRTNGKAPSDADRRLAEARELQEQAAERQPEVDELERETDRLAKGNNLAKILYQGLLSGGHN